MVASPRQPEEIPVSIEPVVGWRAWRLVRENGELRLGSLVQGGSWTPQHVRPAICAAHGRPRAHASPHEHCTCGYYATDSWESLCAANVFGNDVGVVGAIGQWGTVIEHGHGARSEFAYPARLRLVCAPCIKTKVVRDPVVVLDNGAGWLSPRCDRHASGGRSTGIDAKAIEWELLNTYGVELLPRPKMSRRARWGLTFRPGVPKAGQVGMWAAIAVFMVIRFVISAMFALWLLGLALAVAGMIVGGAYNLVTGRGHDQTPTSLRSDGAVQPPVPDVYPAEVRRFAGLEPHRGKPPVLPPPKVALPCGVGLGDHVELATCADPRVDLLGFAAQSDPRGPATDCIVQSDAYSSGPHWFVCWSAPGRDAWIDPFPTSPNPFIHPLGGVLDGDR